MKLFFIKFVDDTQRERVFRFNLFGRVWQQGGCWGGCCEVNELYCGVGTKGGLYSLSVYVSFV